MSCCSTMPRMNLIIIGLPGSGKGTQSKMLADHYGIKHITSGDLLREESEKDTGTAAEIRELMKTGRLFSDELVEKVLIEKVPRENFILDGYPRKLSQVGTFKDIDLVLYLDLPEDEALKRILDRQQGRSDDNRETAKVRLHVFKKETEPLINHYRQKGILETIDGSKGKEDVFSSIKEAVYRRFQV